MSLFETPWREHITLLTILQSRHFQPVCWGRSTGVCHTQFLKRAIADLFLLDCQIKKDNSQHNNSCPLWMNEWIKIIFLGQIGQNYYIFGVLQNFSKYVCHEMKRVFFKKKFLIDQWFPALPFPMSSYNVLYVPSLIADVLKKKKSKKKPCKTVLLQEHLTSCIPKCSQCGLQ